MNMKTLNVEKLQQLCVSLDNYTFRFDSFQNKFNSKHDLQIYNYIWYKRLYCLKEKSIMDFLEYFKYLLIENVCIYS